MVTLVLIVLLVLFVLSAVPTYSVRRRYGYGPMLLAFSLIVVLAVWIVERR